jgi:hypothetical protein
MMTARTSATQNNTLTILRIGSVVSGFGVRRAV